jgi:hypothetical protein
VAREDGVKMVSRFVRSTKGKVAVAVLVSTAISVPATVWAVTTFTDVPTSHPFYDEISAVAGAGITQGFGDGTYRPSNNITRQAMAAFMERGVGRAVSDIGTTGVRSVLSSEVAAVALEAGATGSGATGFAVLSGSVFASSAQSTTANCPCTISVDLYENDAIVATSWIQVPKLANGQEALDSTSVEAVVPIASDSARLFRLVVNGANSFGSNMVTATGSITATYMPFSGDGDSTADYDLTCPKDDAWEPNDTQASAATYFMLSAHETHAIACPGDIDWYSDEVEDGWTIEVTVTFSAAEGNIDVCIHKPAGGLVACSLGVGNTETTSYTLDDEEAGTYGIRVFLASDAGSTPGNTYTLTASKTPSAF